MDGNKSPSPDGYHPCFIKELADFIIEPIGIIFRNSMESGTIPSQWKEARVSAIYKKGNKKLASNYRPVSIILWMQNSRKTDSQSNCCIYAIRKFVI